MNGKSKVFKVIKYCLVLVVIIMSVSLSSFSLQRDREGVTTEEFIYTNGSIVEIKNVVEDTDALDYSVEDIINSSSNMVNLISDISLEYMEDIQIKLCMNNMTTEEKVGQLFFVCVKSRFDESILEKYHFGGILFFYDDIKNDDRESLKQKINKFQENSDIPLFVGIDEEGGSVSRLNKNPKLIDYPFLSPRKLYEMGGFDEIAEDVNNKCDLLLEYGFNVNFAPVCDISFDPQDYMYERSFGQSVELTCDYVSVVVKNMDEKKVGSVLKHFPGYGNNGDTHKKIVHDYRSYDEFVEKDFLPFTAGIESNADCILVSHNIVECMDDTVPASLSPVVHDIIRDELEFDGVIITDDLSMDGVLHYMNNSEAAINAILAGNDMIIVTYYKEQYNAVLNAVLSGRIPEERLNNAVYRILKMKRKLIMI